jgi:hypothetical protein
MIYMQNICLKSLYNACGLEYSSPRFKMQSENSYISREYKPEKNKCAFDLASRK